MKLNSFQLKIFAMILMVLDHLVTYVPNMPVWFSYVGRLVAPIFFFFIVEGFFHTRSRLKYTFRLFTWSLVMFTGSKLVVMLFKREYGLHNNIFLSMAMAVLLMSIIEWTKKNKENKKLYVLGIIVAIAAVALSVVTEASIYGVAMTLVFYFLRDKKGKMVIVYIITSLILTLGLSLPTFITDTNYTVYGLFFFDIQWMQVFAFPFFLMYNGKRGLNTKFTKYLFYIFYPVHLWCIYIIGYYLGAK
ncbi:TraX family protein [Clostridium ganghwense]|uniref:TraX family protein n=1 Tax=Clostridium ganghwense TaxID=312089 RepID=A0ABT4CUI9_9CLOT|nr:TraX family protein [Clostridium ganghwense]MCY6371716.1 TraX family protein [Clostridium ganghwense]